MLAFVGPSDLDVNHKDGDKTNNHLSNLEYSTKGENQRHARKLRGNWTRSGEASHLSILTDKQIEWVRRLAADGYSADELAEIFNVSRGHILGVKNGNRRA